MASVNKVTLIGNLGKDPEVRQGGDTTFANVSIGTSESWKDKANGEKRESTEWHRVTFSGRLAEIAERYLKKGAQVYVEGSLRTRKWQDKDGHDRYTTEIRADVLKMLGSPSRADQAESGQGGGGYSRQQPAPRQPQPRAQSNAPQPEEQPWDDDEDIPF